MTQPKNTLNCMTGYVAAIVILVITVCGMHVPVGWTAEGSASCLSTTGEAAVEACRRELLSDPGSVGIRFALSDAFMGLRRYTDAVAVLREGLERFPGDDRIKKKLILAESYLDEQRWIEAQKKSTSASSGSKKQGTQIRLSIIRCKKLKGDAAMAACNEGLKENPNQPELLTGRGNAWLKMDRFGNAILDFEAALAADPKNRDAAKNLRLARARRTVKVAQCLQVDGRAGLEACEAALMTGADDELAVRERRAVLLQAMGIKQEAADGDRIATHQKPAGHQAAAMQAAPPPRIEKPATPHTKKKSAPTAAKAAGPSTVKRLPAPEKKTPIKPTAPEPTPITVASAEPEPKEKPSLPADTSDPIENKKPIQAPIQPSAPVPSAVSQPRQFSNAPEVPGITH